MRLFGAAAVATALLGCTTAKARDGWQMPVGEARAREPTVVEERGDLPDPIQRSHDDFWRSDEGAAWREAEATGRGLFVDFYADWCDECRTVSADTWRDPTLRQLILTRFVPLRLDVTEVTREGREQLERFGVKRLPTSVAVARGGRELLRFRSPPEPEVVIAALKALRPVAGR